MNATSIKRSCIVCYIILQSAMKFDHADSASYLIHHTARLFFEALRKRIKPFGIVSGQFPALLALWKQDGQTQKELAEKLDIEQATMANTINRIKRDGLILCKDHSNVWPCQNRLADQESKKDTARRL